VYRCKQRKLGRDAVVKVLRARPGGYARTKRFVREARLTSQLEHPFSAHVYAFGVEDDGVRWIAMEFVQPWPEIAARGAICTGAAESGARALRPRHIVAHTLAAGLRSMAPISFPASRDSDSGSGAGDAGHLAPFQSIRSRSNSFFTTA
jgi:hypothetical protein